MKILNGISDQPKQVMTLTLADGSKAVWSLNYRAQQIGWFWDLTWNSQPVALGQRLVASPNILRSFINQIPFGLSVLTQGNVEPLNLEDLSDGTTEIVLLEGDDLSLVETAAFGAPAGQTQLVVIGTDGRTRVVPPSQWGPASGDLAGNYPDPRVAAAHVADGQQITFGDIPDGKLVKRVGASFVGADAGAGDVVGPASAVNNHIATFNGTSGKLIKDSGLTSASFDAAGAAAAAQAAAATDATTKANAAQAAAIAASDPAGSAAAVSAALSPKVLPTGGSKYARLAKNSATNYDAGWYGPDVFNVADYGAQPNVVADWGPTISAVCTAALAYAVANNCGATVYFPDGNWYISSHILAQWTNNALLTLRGNGRHSSIIVAQTTNQNGIECLLNAGTPKRNRVTVMDLGFKMVNGFVGGSAIYISYGTTFIGSSENCGGSVVRGIDIENNAEADMVGGWTYGVTMFNAWHFNIEDVYGYGNATTYGSASTPGAGDGGAGSGALMDLRACFNFNVSNIQGNFWGQMLRVAPAGLSGEIASQGAFFQLINCVGCVEFLHVYGVGGSGFDWLTLVNWQCDNGGAHRSDNVTIYLEGPGGNGSISNGGSFLSSGDAHIRHNAVSGMLYSNVHCEGSATWALDMLSTSNGNSFNGCEFAGRLIQFGAGAGLSQVNNTGSSTVTNAGSGNRFLSTLF